MSLRALPPAWSPLQVGAVLSAARALVAGAPAERQPLVADLGTAFPGSVVRLTDSGTTALTLGLRIAAGATRRARVVLPAYACYDLVTAAVGASCAMDFYDVDPGTLSPDWASLRKALQREPAVVVVAHLFGYPQPVDQVASLAGETGALVVDDAAQAIGAMVAGRPAGMAGHLGVLSFGRGKGLTGGSGGALLVNASDLHAAALDAVLEPPSGAARDATLVAALWLLARPLPYGILARLPGVGLGETIYREPHAARGMSAPAAAAVHHALGGVDREAGIRRTNAEQLAASLRGSVRPVVPSGWSEASCLRLPLLAESLAARQALVAKGRMLGLAQGYPETLPFLPAARQEQGAEAGFPGARRLADCLLTAPLHSRVRATDFEAIRRMLQG